LSADPEAMTSLNFVRVYSPFIIVAVLQDSKQEGETAQSLMKDRVMLSLSC